MRKKAVQQVYDVLHSVHQLERKLRSGANLGDADREEFVEHLKRARRQLHEVLERMSSARQRDAA